MNGSQLKLKSKVAYFSMEIGLETSIPTYSGGLGVLAGDTLRAAADLGVPMVGITLLYRKGYFRQHLDKEGGQSETSVDWSVEESLEPTEARATIPIEGRHVQIRAWHYLIQGVSEYSVPVYLLDTAVEENSLWDQSLTDYLYGGDDRYRLCQEAVLGLGGIAILRALGYTEIQTYHMNEGHSALLTLALWGEEANRHSTTDIENVNKETIRQKCVFTTHTPVPAGHDIFPIGLVRQVLGEESTGLLAALGCCPSETLNMTSLALLFSHYINGVAMRHGEISQSMYPSYPVNSITNGVHAATWIAAPFQRIYDRHIPEWRKDNLYLRYAIGIPLNEIRQAHSETKRELIDEVERRTGVSLNPTIMTLGFARRATAYKRADLLFSDLDRLKRIAQQSGPLQIIYGGKAHPKDEGGKSIIRHVFKAAAAMENIGKVVYLEDYDIALGKYLCAGVDVWLNTPQKPREASGTSGMKAALNGVPNLSILDGWWIEGCIEGVTGWSIGDSWEVESNRVLETISLYDKLEYTITPMFYNEPDIFAKIMRSAIALNGAFFNTQRMLSQYVRNAYNL